MIKNLFQISFFVPKRQCEIVKQAMFKAGAGSIGNYQECAWQVLGTGQFRPSKGSTPFLGGEDTLERVEEYKVEIICEEKYLKAVIVALKSSHPYEIPAYFVVKLADI